MKSLKFDCRLVFEQNKWVLLCPAFNISGSEWEDLKTGLIDFLSQNYPGRHIEISYYFDMSSIPKWFHQYQNHYFNGKFKLTT